MSCYLCFFCLHCCLINIHIFDYPDSRLSGLFTEVPTSPDNRGSTVVSCSFVCLRFWVGAGFRSKKGLGSQLGLCVYLGLYCYSLGPSFPSFGCLYICVNSMQLLFVFYYVSLDVFGLRLLVCVIRL